MAADIAPGKRRSRVHGVVSGLSTGALLAAAAPVALWSVGYWAQEAFSTVGLGDTPLGFLTTWGVVLVVLVLVPVQAGRHVARAVRTGRRGARAAAPVLLITAVAVWVPLSAFWAERMTDSGNWREDRAACDEAIEQLLAGGQAERLPMGVSTTDTDGDPGVDRIMENVVIDGELRGIACEVRTDRDGPGPVERVYLRAPWPAA